MYFLADYSLEDISELLNIDMNTIRFYVYGENGAGNNEHCWLQIKKKLGSTAVSTFVKDKIGVLSKTSGIALSLVNENLRRLQEQFEKDSSFTMTIDDTRKLASIMVDMDKIIRLESGKPTDIVDSVANMTIADARRILAEDPFAPEVDETIDAEFEEISDKEIIADIQTRAPWTKYILNISTLDHTPVGCTSSSLLNCCERFLYRVISQKLNL